MFDKAQDKVAGNMGLYHLLSTYVSPPKTNREMNTLHGNTTFQQQQNTIASLTDPFLLLAMATLRSILGKWGAARGAVKNVTTCH